MIKGDTILICVEDRYFEKLHDLEPIPVKVEEIKPGNIFMMYEDSAKKTICHWDDANVFKCISDELVTNECDCRYIACVPCGKKDGSIIRIDMSIYTNEDVNKKE